MQRDENTWLGILIVIGVLYYIWKGLSWLGSHPFVLWMSIVGSVILISIVWYFWHQHNIQKEREEAENYRSWKFESEKRELERVRDEIAKHAAWNRIQHMKPREFEQFIAQIYRAKGYQVELTRATGDGGKDVILKKNGSIVAYVECKHWKKKVGEPEVRSLLGAMSRDGVEKGIFVSTSDYTPSARRMAGSKIQLINRNALMSMIAVSQNIHDQVASDA